MKLIILTTLILAPAMTLASPNSDCIQDIVDGSIIEAYNNECDCSLKLTLEQIIENFKSTTNYECYEMLTTEEKARVEGQKNYYIQACYASANSICR